MNFREAFSPARPQTPLAPAKVSNKKLSCYNRKIRKNKRGTDKIISVYWFAILFIVAVAVVYMVYSFYGAPYDIREAEANAMINQIADCITEGNNLNHSIDNENFMSECHLNFDTESDKELGVQYYAEVPLLGVSQGNVNLKEYCDKKGDKLPKCLERSFYTLSDEDVKIKVVVNKVSKNA